MNQEIPPRDARQGRLGSRVLIILVCALILAMLAWGAAEIYGWSIAPETPSGDPSTPVPDDGAEPGPASG